MKAWWLACVLALWAPMAAAAPPAADAAGLAGRYELVGMMETAAELDLRADGRFSWAMSVGSLDMVAEGNWTLAHGFVTLKADGADAEIAKLIRLERVGRVEEWRPLLPADHPLQAHPRGIAVRILDVDGYGPSSFMAFAGLEGGGGLDWQAESLGETDRWSIADLAPGQQVAALHVLVAAQLSRDIDVTLKPGDVAEVAISLAPLREQEKLLMMTLEVDKDGALTPDSQRFSERPARYVRY